MVNNKRDLSAQNSLGGTTIHLEQESRLERELDRKNKV